MGAEAWRPHLGNGGRSQARWAISKPPGGAGAHDGSAAIVGERQRLSEICLATASTLRHEVTAAWRRRIATMGANVWLWQNLLYQSIHAHAGKTGATLTRYDFPDHLSCVTFVAKHGLREMYAVGYQQQEASGSGMLHNIRVKPASPPPRGTKPNSTFQGHESTFSIAPLSADIFISESFGGASAYERAAASVLSGHWR